MSGFCAHLHHCSDQEPLTKYAKIPTSIGNRLPHSPRTCPDILKLQPLEVGIAGARCAVVVNISCISWLKNLLVDLRPFGVQPSETALALGVIDQSFIEFRNAKIGPEQFCNVKFRITDLPEQKIAQS